MGRRSTNAGLPRVALALGLCALLALLAPLLLARDAPPRIDAQELARVVDRQNRTIALLQEHLLPHTRPTSQLMHRTRLPAFYDALCDADVMMPERFELRALQNGKALFLAGQAAALSSTARDVGALAPPARLSTATSRGCSENPMRTAREWLDVPALLRDST